MDHAVISDQWLATLRYVGAGAAAPLFWRPFLAPLWRKYNFAFPFKKSLLFAPLFGEKQEKLRFEPPTFKNPCAAPESDHA